MAETRFDVLTIGNAIVDVITSIEPGFLYREGLAVGIMHLVDAERSRLSLRSHAGGKAPDLRRQRRQHRGGRCLSGWSRGFIGKVAERSAGDVFATISSTSASTTGYLA